VARNATEAIGFIDSGETFDLLFTDIIMPGGINGLELARMVKQRRPLTKVLFASGFSQTPVQDIELLGANYITKPYRKIDIARIIRELLEKR
jgi:DNA-binding LytR/AlgR family response regulator